MSTSNDNNATDYGSRAIDERLTKDDWSRFEKSMTDFEKNVLQSLKIYANTVINGNAYSGITIKNTKLALGDYFYLLVRDSFLRIEKGNDVINLVKPINQKAQDFSVAKKQKQKNKKQNPNKITVADIREKSALTKLNDAVNNIMKIYQTYAFNIDNYGFNSKYIEFVGMTFIYTAEIIIRSKESYADNIGRVWELMVSMQRFLKMIDEYIGVSIIDASLDQKISNIFIDDLRASYERLEKIFPFNGVEICRKVPELLVNSPYDKYVSSSSIKPREHQMEICNKVYNHFNNGFFIVYNSMINSGKTTTVVALGNIARNFDKVLLCVCNLQTVRDQMCCMFNNSDVSFANASVSQNGDVKISKSYSSQRDIEAIVCGLDVAVRLVENEPNKYIIFHDEPTIGADVEESLSLRLNVRLLMTLSKWYIFSSATSPTTDELSVITNRIKTVHPTLVVDTVYSPTVQIACEVRTQSGNVVVPYLGCKTSEDVLSTIKKIQDIPFLGRMLTPDIAIGLWSVLNFHKVNNVPDIPVLLKDVNNIRADKIRVIVLEMLRLVSTLSNEQIESICASNMLSNGQTSDMNYDANKIVNMMNLGTTELYKGMTLVVSTEPLNYVSNFANLLEDLKKVTKSANNIVNRYTNEMCEWTSRKEKIMSNLKMTENEKIFKEQEIDSEKPQITFPNWAQIATVEHSTRYNYGNKNVIDIRPLNNIETIINRKIAISRKQEGNFMEMTRVSDDLLLLLFCGVGFYAPSDSRVDHHYTNLVMELASTGNLAFVIGDNSITFGTNHPYGRTIIDDKFSNRHSINTLFQLMGRAGRVGKFPKAESIVTDDIGRKLIDFTINPAKYNTEIINITNMIITIENEQKQQMDEKIKKVQETIIDEVSNVEIVNMLGHTNNDPIIQQDDAIIQQDDAIIQQDDAIIQQDEAKTDDIPESWDDVDFQDDEISVQEPTVKLDKPTNNECNEKWRIAMIESKTGKDTEKLPIIPLKTVINREYENQQTQKNKSVHVHVPQQQTNTWRSNDSSNQKNDNVTNSEKETKTLYVPPHMRNKTVSYTK